MESPRLIPADKVDIPTDISEQTTNLVSEIPSVDASKISQEPEINNAKAINHENSRILPEASVEAQDLSETTKSDRKSTGEAEETQSQQAQQVKSEEDNGDGSKSSDNQAAENLPESRETGEVLQEIHQSSESQENISQENVENKENHKSEPESQEAEEKAVEQEVQAEIQEKSEEKTQEPIVVEEKNVVEEKHEVPQSENVVAEVEQRDSEVKEEQNVVNTEVQNEVRQEEEPVVESQPIEEPQPEVQVSESKVENIEVQEPVKEPEAPIEEIKPVEEVTENKVEEQNNNTEAVKEVQPVIENKAEEQNNIEAVQVNEEIKPVEEVPETKPEEQNNEVQAPIQEEVVKTEEIKKSEPVQEVEQKVEPVVEQQKGVFDFPVQEEAKPVEAEKVEPVVQEPIQEEQKPEPVVEHQKGVFDFPVQEEAQAQAKTEESNKQEEVPVKVEEKKEEVQNPPAAEEVPKETRSPKLKNLRINTQQNNVVTRIINYCAKTGEPLPDASVAEADKKGDSSELPASHTSVNSEGSSEVKKHYDTNQSLTDLLKPIDMEAPQASPIIKRNATSTTCLANPAEEPKEETKEAQQPASAMIQSTSKARLTMDDFQKITSLGRGSYGEVFLVKKIANGKLYALKSIDKNFMKKEKKEHQVYVEREVLMKLNHPNIIKLVSSFQDKAKLYFVLEYVSGGEFSDYLRVQGKLSKEQIIFFSAEIINILEYLHTFGIAHRDMKPENLLLTAEGHIKCIDFGTARFLGNDKRTADLYNIKKGEDTLEVADSVQKKNHRSTFVGTAQYVSPEMLEGSDCGAPADIWALGCMIYLMAVGKFPFIDMNEYLIFQKIKAASVVYPEDMDEEIKDIIKKLLVKEPTARLGAGEKDSGNGYEALKGHPLFKNTDFSTLNEQKPPVIEIASPHKKKSHDLQSAGNSNVGMQNMQGNRKVNSEDLTKPSPAKTGQAFNFQSDNQVKSILSGLVLKKCGWLWFKPRQLILNNKPRLVYYDPDTNQLKGEIPLAPTTKAELESKTKFIVNCPNKKFVFKEMEHSAEKWVEIINKTVEQLYAKKPDQ